MQEAIDGIDFCHSPSERKAFLTMLMTQKEKEQIIKAWEDGDYAYFYSKETGRDFDNGEEYYKDVYSTKEVNDDKYSIFDCYGMIVKHYGITMTFEKAKNLIDKLNISGDGFAPYKIEKNNQTYNQNK